MSVQVTPGRADPLPAVGYEAILRAPSRPGWLGVIGVLLAICLYTLALSVVAQAFVALGWLAAGRPAAFPTYLSEAMRFEHPSGLLATNLAIACLIPISAVMVAVVHRVRPRWLTSVSPGVRWRYLVACALVALVVLNTVLALSVWVTRQPWEIHPQTGIVAFLVVIALTTPIQSAAEEVFFRGYLLQALGSLGSGTSALSAVMRSRWFAVVASAFLFACFHGISQQNLPLFLDRFGFGLVAGWLVTRTGGLEAAIGAHVVNNICAWVYAALTTSIAHVRATSHIGWIDALFDVGGFTLFALVAVVVADRMNVPRLTPGGSGLSNRAVVH